MFIVKNVYTCLNKDEFEFEGCLLVPYRFEDLIDIKNWRNSQINILRQKKPLTDADQRHYYHFQIEPSFREENPKIILFSFLKINKPLLVMNTLIGYGGLTNIDWNNHKAEISFLLDTDLVVYNTSIYKKYFTFFLTLIKEIAFSELKLNRLFTETFSFRINHMDILEKNGFIKEGMLRENMYQYRKYYDSIIHSCLRSDYYV